MMALGTFLTLTTPMSSAAQPGFKEQAGYRVGSTWIVKTSPEDVARKLSGLSSSLTHRVRTAVKACGSSFITWTSGLQDRSDMAVSKKFGKQSAGKDSYHMQGIAVDFNADCPKNRMVQALHEQGLRVGCYIGHTKWHADESKLPDYDCGSSGLASRALTAGMKATTSLVEGVSQVAQGIENGVERFAQAVGTSPRVTKQKRTYGTNKTERGNENISWAQEIFRP